MYTWHAYLALSSFPYTQAQYIKRWQCQDGIVIVIDIESSNNSMGVFSLRHVFQLLIAASRKRLNGAVNMSLSYETQAAGGAAQCYLHQVINSIIRGGQAVRLLPAAGRGTAKQIDKLPND